jgi:hypothetical protein
MVFMTVIVVMILIVRMFVVTSAVVRVLVIMIVVMMGAILAVIVVVRMSGCQAADGKPEKDASQGSHAQEGHTTPQNVWMEVTGQDEIQHPLVIRGPLEIEEDGD